MFVAFTKMYGMPHVNTGNHVWQSIWKYIRKKCGYAWWHMWYWNQSDTQDHAFPYMIITPWNLGQSGETCVKLTHVANQGKVWQTRPVNEIEPLNLLYSTPHFSTHLHTLPTLPQFASCYMCQSVIFGFPRIAPCPNCEIAGQCMALWKSVSTVH